ncbi:unnamed protein product, partial [Ectocarpus sp. 8 AP-2014]
LWYNILAEISAYYSETSEDLSTYRTARSRQNQRGHRDSNNAGTRRVETGAAHNHRSRGSSQSVRGSCSVAWKLACAAKKKHIFIKGSEERASERASKMNPYSGHPGYPNGPYVPGQQSPSFPGLGGAAAGGDAAAGGHGHGHGHGGAATRRWQ